MDVATASNSQGGLGVQFVSQAKAPVSCVYEYFSMCLCVCFPLYPIIRIIQSF